ncbi:TPA: hypothetical protein ACPSKB_000605 [Legionella feeleii]
MRSVVEVHGDSGVPPGKSIVRLLTSNSTLEPVLALERSDKIIQVTAARPPVPAPPLSYYSFFNIFSYFQKPQPVPNLNPYQLYIEIFTGEDIAKQSAKGKLLKTAEIDDLCADSLESDMLAAVSLFTKYDNACSLVVNLLRKCTDLRIKREWINDIFAVDNDSSCQSPIQP